jgi:hypothetical protein
MKTLQIDEKNAMKLYKSASDEFKTTLEDTFGKDFFQIDVLDRIKTYEDAQEETGRPDVPKFSEVPEDLRKFFQSFYKVIVINEALNEGERFDIYDNTVNRYYTWFRTNGSPSGFAFDGSYCANAAAAAGSGSRLCLKSEKIANYVGNQFVNEYRELLDS